VSDDRDDIEGPPLDLIPLGRAFPIESYTRILASGKAAASKKRYLTHEEATTEAHAVGQMITYYRRNHPELAPQSHGYRVWESREDGRYRWAIMPMARPRRAINHEVFQSRERLGRPR